MFEKKEAVELLLLKVYDIPEGGGVSPDAAGLLIVALNARAGATHKTKSI
jgi:hypothetical protein